MGRDMSKDSSEKSQNEDECIIHDHPVPPEELSRYSIEHDPYSEADIASYVEGQARDETVKYVERIKSEIVLGDTYEIWDVTTDVDRWWVITNLTNLYSQKHFPSMDYTLSFHIGLMMRLRNRSDRVDPDEPSLFDDVFRREEQAEAKHDSAIEGEDFQSVGLLLRESLIALVGAIRRSVELAPDIETPKNADFKAWTEVFANQLCGGKSNKELRQHLKNMAKEAWQLVNWLTHSTNADKTASSVAIHSCQTVIGHFIQVLEKSKTDKVATCPICRSRKIRSHYDIAIGNDGDYFLSCGTCDWDNHPGVDQDYIASSDVGA